MIVFLLIVIVLILLFGASAFLAAVGGVIGWIAALILLAIAYVWLGPVVSAAAPTIAILIVSLCAIVGSVLAWREWAAERRRKYLASGPTWHHDIQPSGISVPDGRPVERIWGRFADDIASHFDNESQLEAKRLFEANDARGLYRFCLNTLERVR